MEDKEKLSDEIKRLELTKALLSLIKTPQDLVIIDEIIKKLMTSFLEFYEKHKYSNN